MLKEIFEVVLIVALLLVGVSLLIIAIKGGIEIKHTKHVIEEKKTSEIELAIAKQNLEEMKRYNDNIANNNQANKTMQQQATQVIQEILGVSTDEQDD